jgi:hypothetical protein
MQLFRRAFGVSAVVALLTVTPSAVHAQRGDSYTWKIGLQAGSIIYETRTQESEFMPSGGAHVLIMAARGGLMFGIDEGFGSEERSGAVMFNDLRRYQAVLVAFPVALPLEPYFGAGGGIMQVVSPTIDPIITDPFERAELQEQAREASTHAYATALFGLQGRWGRLTAFGQAQVTTGPGDDKLLRGAAYSIHGGIRIGLGSAKEGIRAGGY